LLCKQHFLNVAGARDRSSTDGMNLPLSVQQVTARLDFTMKILHSYLQYVGLAKFAKAAKTATKTLLQLQEINLA
jgi:hypothetical protein